MQYKPCPVGRVYDVGHKTCQTCAVPGCLSRSVASTHAVPFSGKERGNRAGKVRSKPFKLTNPVETEDVEQVNLAKWLDFKKLLWAHIPNGGNRDIVTGARLKKQGVKRGIPDVLIFCPPPALPDKIGTAVELKRRHGGVVSEDQERWIDGLSRRNWHVAVCKGWEHAVQFLKEAGY